jgi:hypothetical protein
MMRRGYSRDHRPDCEQMVIALIVNSESFPFSYETFDGNRAAVSRMETILRMVERKYGKARRSWVLDRGIVSEEKSAGDSPPRRTVSGGYAAQPDEAVRRRTAEARLDAGTARGGSEESGDLAGRGDLHPVPHGRPQGKKRKRFATGFPCAWKVR